VVELGRRVIEAGPNAIDLDTRAKSLLGVIRSHRVALETVSSTPISCRSWTGRRGPTAEVAMVAAYLLLRTLASVLAKPRKATGAPQFSFRPESYGEKEQSTPRPPKEHVRVAEHGTPRELESVVKQIR
jgi:hypothetical protein